MIISKIKANFVFKDLRFNSSFFLNQDAINSRLLEENRDKCLPLSEFANVFNPPIFKRQFCQNTENAIPYCQSSDITNMLEGSEVFINKAQAIKVGSVVSKNQILVTGFGTIGNVKLANELTDGISYANNVCRIEVNSKNLNGFIYAFMASKFGKSQLNKNGSGSVVKYIEAPGIKKTLIPLFDFEEQNRIHCLIMESSKLIVEANKLLFEAIAYFEKLDINYVYGKKINQLISINNVSTDYKRFDASFAIVSEMIEKSFLEKSVDYKNIYSQSNGIFIGPRSKRNYVENGIPFLNTSVMQKLNPTKTEKFISQKTSNGFIVSEGWILTTRSGTLGETVFTLPCMNGYAVTEDAIRIIIKDGSELSNHYIYAFLKSKIGKSSLLSGSYGSVIQHLNEEYIGNIKIPVLNVEIRNKINYCVEMHIKMLNDAIVKENQAIDLIEKEIESWQKS